MNTFIRFFYEFISIFFEGIAMVFGGIFNGIIKMFNFMEYAKVIDSYKDSFNGGEKFLRQGVAHIGRLLGKLCVRNCKFFTGIAAAGSDILRFFRKGRGSCGAGLENSPAGKFCGSGKGRRHLDCSVGGENIFLFAQKRIQGRSGSV